MGSWMQEDDMADAKRRREQKRAVRDAAILRSHRLSQTLSQVAASAKCSTEAARGVLEANGLTPRYEQPGRVVKSRRRGGA